MNTAPADAEVVPTDAAYRSCRCRIPFLRMLFTGIESPANPRQSSVFWFKLGLTNPFLIFFNLHKDQQNYHNHQYQGFALASRAHPTACLSAKRVKNCFCRVGYLYVGSLLKGLKHVFYVLK